MEASMQQAWDELQSVPAYTERYSENYVCVPIIPVEEAEDMLHTAENGYVCGDPQCACAGECA